MNRDRRFVFDFAVSRSLLVEFPDDAQKLISHMKAGIESQETVRGPRGGTYRLITPPDEWRSSDQSGDDWMRNMMRFATKRWGRYQRPRR